MSLRMISAIRLSIPLGAGLDPGEDVEADQPRQNDGHAVAMQPPDPWLTQGGDTENHDPLRPRFKIAGADFFEAHRAVLGSLGRAHLRIAPKVTPRKRCLRRRNVKIATGSRNRNEPTAITVQSVNPEPTCEGIKGGAVWALRLVRIRAKAYSFQAVMKQNTAVAAIPVTASGSTI